MGKPDIDQPVHYGIEGNVGRVEAELNQYFLNPQVLRRGANDAVE
jgi:hypothetical protein